MNLPDVYAPLTGLKGFVGWKFDERCDVLQFYYERKVRNNCLQIFLYIFRHENYGGLDCRLAIPEKGWKNAERFSPIEENYREAVNEILEQRDRVKKALRRKRIASPLRTS